MTYSFNCDFCGIGASSTQEKTKFCSARCRGESYLKRSGRVRAFPIPSGTSGAIAELEVSAYLMKNNYSVFRALSPSCFCDLVAIQDGSDPHPFSGTFIRLNFPPHSTLGFFANSP